MVAGGVTSRRPRWYTLSPCSPAHPSGQTIGEFCGNDGIGGDPNALYECDGNGGVTRCTNCPNGCIIEPSGTNDYCA